MLSLNKFPNDNATFIRYFIDIILMESVGIC